MKSSFHLSAQLRYWDVILITIGISGLALILALISGCIFGSRKVRYDLYYETLFLSGEFPIKNCSIVITESFSLIENKGIS